MDNKTVLELPKRLRWPLLELVLANAFDQPAAMIDEDPEQAVLWCYQLRGCWGAPWPYLSEGCRNHLAQYLKSALEASSWGKVEQVAREALLEVRFPLRTTMLASERNKLDPIDAPPFLRTHVFRCLFRLNIPTDHHKKPLSQSPFHQQGRCPRLHRWAPHLLGEAPASTRRRACEAVLRGREAGARSEAVQEGRREEPSLNHTRTQLEIIYIYIYIWGLGLKGF